MDEKSMDRDNRRGFNHFGSTSFEAKGGARRSSPTDARRGRRNRDGAGRSRRTGGRGGSARGSRRGT